MVRETEIGFGQTIEAGGGIGDGTKGKGRNGRGIKGSEASEDLSGIYAIGDSGQPDLNLIRMYFREINSISINVENHAVWGAKIMGGQMALNYLSEMENLPKEATDLFLNPKIRTMDFIFKRRLARIRSVTGREKPTELDKEDGVFDGKTDEDKKKDLELLEIVDHFKEAVDRGLATEDREQVINELIDMVKQATGAYDQLTEANMRLVVAIAKKYIKPGLFLEDLVGYGNIGLITAVCKFDFRKGYRFSTFANWWVRQAIKRSIADYEHTIRIPVRELERMQKFQRELMDTSPEEESRVWEKYTRNDGLLLSAYRALSIDSLNKPTGENGQLEDIIPGEEPVDQEAEKHDLSIKAALMEAIECCSLTPREKEVIFLYSGIRDCNPRTLEDVGKEFNVSRERVRQIRARALKKLSCFPRLQEIRESMRT